MSYSCPRCGQVVEDAAPEDVKYCQHCGEPATAEAARERSERQDSLLRRLMVVFGGLWLALFFIPFGERSYGNVVWSWDLLEDAQGMAHLVAWPLVLSLIFLVLGLVKPLPAWLRHGVGLLLGLVAMGVLFGTEIGGPYGRDLAFLFAGGAPWVLMFLAVGAGLLLRVRAPRSIAARAMIGVGLLLGLVAYLDGAMGESTMIGALLYQLGQGGVTLAIARILMLLPLAPASSALATGIGLRLLDEMGCDSDHPMVQRAVRYLVETHDASTGVWRGIPEGANEHPHAPWWHDDGGSLARSFDGYRIIPRTAIVGLLHRYGALVPRPWLNDVTEHTVKYVESVARLGTGGGDDLIYAIMLAETPELPKRFKTRLIARIRQVIPDVVVRDPTKWGSYCITPLKVAPSPSSLAAASLQDVLPINLDDLIERQGADGAWEPTWSWGEAYPEAWQQAQREWRGSLTLDALTTLRAYDRIQR